VISFVRVGELDRADHQRLSTTPRPRSNVSNRSLIGKPSGPIRAAAPTCRYLADYLDGKETKRVPQRATRLHDALQTSGSTAMVSTGRATSAEHRPRPPFDGEISRATLISSQGSIRRRHLGRPAADGRRHEARDRRRDLSPSRLSRRRHWPSRFATVVDLMNDSAGWAIPVKFLAAPRMRITFTYLRPSSQPPVATESTWPTPPAHGQRRSRANSRQTERSYDDATPHRMATDPVQSPAKSSHPARRYGNSPERSKNRAVGALVVK